MWWWKKQVPPADRPTPAYTTPEMDLEALGPVVRHNHIAYVPAREFSGVPGVGTGNLAYAPDLLLTAPAYFGGNAIARQANILVPVHRPVMITQPKTILEGIGGITAGQLIHQPLLEVEINQNSANGNSEVGE